MLRLYLERRCVPIQALEPLCGFRLWSVVVFDYVIAPDACGQSIAASVPFFGQAQCDKVSDMLRYSGASCKRVGPA